MTFRDRLLGTIRAARPVLEDPGVLVVGSEVRAERVDQIASARPVPVRLSRELLEAQCLALTPFETAAALNDPWVRS